MNASNARRGANMPRHEFIPPDHASVKRDRPKPPARKADFVDAEFEVLRVPLKGYYRTVNDNRRPTTVPSRGNWALALLKSAVGLAERLLRQLSGRNFSALVAGCFAFVFLAVWLFGGSGPEIGAEPSAGIAITDVSRSIVDSNGLRVIEITGFARNNSREALATPRLVARLSDDAGAEPLAFFKLSEPVLSAGESIPFSLRLPHPGGKVPNVSVTADAASL